MLNSEIYFKKLIICPDNDVISDLIRQFILCEDATRRFLAINDFEAQF